MVGLQKRLQRYFSLLNSGSDFSKEITEVKSEMSALEKERNKGVMFRSKEKELEEGERCTRYFFQKKYSQGREHDKIQFGRKGGKQHKRNCTRG